MTDMLVAIPYNLEPHELKIDPAAMGREFTDVAKFFTQDEWFPPWIDREKEAEHIMRGAVVLYQHLKQTGAESPDFAECLATAIIWERG